MIILLNNELKNVSLVARNDKTGACVIRDNDGKEYIISTKKYDDEKKKYNQTTNSRGFLNLLLLSLVVLISFASCTSKSQERQEYLTVNCVDTTEVHVHHYPLVDSQKKILADKDLLIEWLNAPCASKQNMFFKHIYKTKEQLTQR